MQIIQLNLKDDIIENIKKEFYISNLKEALNKVFEKYKYLKEYKIAQDINKAIKEVKNGKTRTLESLLNEI